MAFDALLKTFIYIVSASLFYPVLFLLVVVFLWIIVLSGGFFGQWLQRIRQEKPRPEDLPAIILNKNEGTYLPHHTQAFIKRLRMVVHDPTLYPHHQYTSILPPICRLDHVFHADAIVHLGTQGIKWRR